MTDSKIYDIGKTLAALSNQEMIAVSEHLTRNYPTLADQLSSNINWTFFEIELDHNT